MATLIKWAIILAVAGGTWATWLYNHDAKVREKVVKTIQVEEDRQTRARRNEIKRIKKEVEALPDVPSRPDELERLCQSDPHCES